MVVESHLRKKGRRCDAAKATGQAQKRRLTKRPGAAEAGAKTKVRERRSAPGPQKRKRRCAIWGTGARTVGQAGAALSRPNYPVVMAPIAVLG